MAGRPTGAELERQRRHFEIERELADRLRRATREQRRELYGEVYAELFRRVELPGNREAQLGQVDLLLALLEPLLPGASSFLEIGAGSCELSLAVAGRLDTVWAVDAVDPALDPAVAPTGFRFVLDRDADATVPAGSVDVALSCHFVEHLHADDLREHLGRVRSRLRTGGVYVVVTPNRLYGPHDISRHFADEPLGFHLREYSHVELAGELRSAGFDPVGVIGGIGTMPTGAVPIRIAAVERVLDALPSGLRRRLLDRAPRRPPFRPLEQVKIAGFKPEPGS